METVWRQINVCHVLLSEPKVRGPTPYLKILGVKPLRLGEFGEVEEDFVEVHYVASVVYFDAFAFVEGVSFLFVLWATPDLAAGVDNAVPGDDVRVREFT